jgi:hypothetical protein
MLQRPGVRLAAALSPTNRQVYVVVTYRTSRESGASLHPAVVIPAEGDKMGSGCGI